MRWSPSDLESLRLAKEKVVYCAELLAEAFDGGGDEEYVKLLEKNLVESVKQYKMLKETLEEKYSEEE